MGRIEEENRTEDRSGRGGEGKIDQKKMRGREDKNGKRRGR